MRQGDAQEVGLADELHVGAEARLDARGVHGLGGDERAALGLLFGEDAVDAGEVEAGDRLAEAGDEVVAEVGGDAAERVGEAGAGGDHHAGDAEFAGERGGVEGPAPPKAKRVKSRGSAPRESETRRMAPAMRVSAMVRTACAAASAVRPRGGGEVPGDGVAGGVGGGEGVGVEAAEEEVGVGDGRARAAAAGGDRAGVRAGAVGADFEEAGGGDAGDGAAAGADAAHVDHRDVDRHGVFELDLVGDRRLGVADQGDVGGGAAHVAGNEVGDARAGGGVGGGHDAGGGAGHHGLRRLAGDGAGGDHAAVAGHHQEVAEIAADRELGAEAGDVAFEDGLDRGVDGGGDAALVLAALGEERVAGGDVGAGPGLGGDRGGAAFVGRIGVGVDNLSDPACSISELSLFLSVLNSSTIVNASVLSSMWSRPDNL